MILLLDHLSAVVIGSAIILILISMQMRSTEMGVEQSSGYMMKNQATDLATWMEEDLLQIGRNIDKEERVAFENPLTNSSGNTSEFVFYRDTIRYYLTTPDTLHIGTRYTLTPVDTRILNEDTLVVHRIDRFANVNGGAWNKTGSSVPYLSSFNVDMLDSDAQPIVDPVAAATADPLAVRNTRIRFSMVTPYETSRTTVRQVYYGSTLLIPN